MAKMWPEYVEETFTKHKIRIMKKFITTVVIMIKSLMSEEENSFKKKKLTSIQRSDVCWSQNNFITGYILEIWEKERLKSSSKFASSNVNIRHHAHSPWQSSDRWWQK